MEESMTRLLLILTLILLAACAASAEF